MSSRDGRGNPGRYVPKNQPRLKLADLLKRRKMPLKQMLHEHGITAYETLVIRCQRMGVLPPTEAEFREAMPVPINSAQEGVVVLEAPPVIEEQSGRSIDPEAPIFDPGIVVLTDEPFVPPTAVENGSIEPTNRPQKKLPKKGESQPPK